jgi:hypothetical protein
MPPCGDKGYLPILVVFRAVCQLAVALIVVNLHRALKRLSIYADWQALMRQILYGAACNRLHGMEERYAWRLLMTHDRGGIDMSTLTQ